jgi:hypothetical protein
MPIKPENKNRYPKNWKEISEDIRFNRAKNRCEICGVHNYSVGYYEGRKFITLSKPPFNHPLNISDYKAALEIKEHYNEWCEQEPKSIIIVLTVAHLDHIPEHCQPENLKAMCQKCHNNYDKQHRKSTISQSKAVGVGTLF